MSKHKLQEIAFVLICIAAVAAFLGLIFVATNNFMPTTVIGRVVAYRQTIDPIMKYKYTVVVMVYDTIIFKDESETPISTGERKYRYSGWHDFELGSVYKIYSKGEWHWAVPSIVEIAKLPES